MGTAWIRAWLIRNTPSCKEVVRLLSDAMDRPIPLHRRIALRLHLLTCTWCLRYKEQIALIRSLLRSTEPGPSIHDLPQGPGVRLSDETRERLKRLTRQEPS
jgi:hypothetical protein